MAKRATKSVIITARITPALNRKLEAYAKSMKRSKSQMIETVMDNHLDYELWFVNEVQKGIDSARRGELIPQDEVFAKLRTKSAQRRRTVRKAA